MSEFRKNWTEDKLKVIIDEWNEASIPASSALTEETEEA
jgi:hypothetical protein